MIKIVTIKIETRRLILKNLQLNDISHDYVNWLNNPEINKYLSCANIPQTMETCMAYAQSYQKRNDAALIGMFLKEALLHIGNLTLSTIDWHNKTVAIGTTIGRKEYMGKGLAREALTATVKYCFEELGLHRVWAGINTTNTKSLKLYKECGFKIEGLLREANNVNGKFQDGHLLSVLQTDV